MSLQLSDDKNYLSSTNTSGLLSLIFMINMQHRFVNLNETSRRIGEFQVKLTHYVDEISVHMDKGHKHIRRGLNNIKML